jgi:hypothetical protein
MKVPWFENAKWYALAGGLAAVLALLAALQYESSRQISHATTEQMLANLEGALMNLRRGLESELTPLCRDLQQSETEPGIVLRRIMPEGLSAGGGRPPIRDW